MHIKGSYTSYPNETEKETDFINIFTSKKPFLDIDLNNYMRLHGVNFLNKKGETGLSQIINLHSHRSDEKNDIKKGSQVFMFDNNTLINNISFKDQYTLCCFYKIDYDLNTIEEVLKKFKTLMTDVSFRKELSDINSSLSFDKYDINPDTIYKTNVENLTTTRNWKPFVTHDDFYNMKLKFSKKNECFLVIKSGNQKSHNDLMVYIEKNRNKGIVLNDFISENPFWKLHKINVQKNIDSLAYIISKVLNVKIKSRERKSELEKFYAYPTLFFEINNFEVYKNLTHEDFSNFIHSRSLEYALYDTNLSRVNENINNRNEVYQNTESENSESISENGFIVYFKNSQIVPFFISHFKEFVILLKLNNDFYKMTIFPLKDFNENDHFIFIPLPSELTTTNDVSYTSKDKDRKEKKEKKEILKKIKHIVNHFKMNVRFERFVDSDLI